MALACLCVGPVQGGGDPLTVFAAASLKNVLDDVAADFEQSTGHHVTLSLAGSSVLARQIELGAPADVFISANGAWMDELEHAGALRPDTRFDLAANRLVLIAHGPAEPVVLGPDLDLAGLLNGGHLSMALIQAVPAGIYGQAALQHFGLWADVAGQVAQADNVRAALAMVAIGHTPLGIVYATDALAENRVTAIATFPADSHPPILYPAAAVAGHDSPAVGEFLAFLRSDAILQTFARHGFQPGKVAP